MKQDSITHHYNKEKEANKMTIEQKDIEEFGDFCGNFIHVDSDFKGGNCLFGFWGKDFEFSFRMSIPSLKGLAKEIEQLLKNETKYELDENDIYFGDYIRIWEGTRYVFMRFYEPDVSVEFPKMKKEEFNEDCKFLIEYLKTKLFPRFGRYTPHRGRQGNSHDRGVWLSPILISKERRITMTADQSEEKGSKIHTTEGRK
jgi:hypothetical protein